jgi:hypothetical protein
VVNPSHQPYHATIHDRTHWIIPSSAFMRICVSLYISTPPDSRRIRKNPFIIRTRHKRPGRWAFRGERAAYGAYTLAAIRRDVFTPALVIYSSGDIRNSSPKVVSKRDRISGRIPPGVYPWARRDPSCFRSLWPGRDHTPACGGSATLKAAILTRTRLWIRSGFALDSLLPTSAVKYKILE